MLNSPVTTPHLPLAGCREFGRLIIVGGNGYHIYTVQGCGLQNYPRWQNIMRSRLVKL